MILNCPICGSAVVNDYLATARHKLVKCVSCGLIRVADFRSEETSYAEDGYFAERNQYVQRWDEFSAIFDNLMAKIARFKRAGRLLDVGSGVGCLISSALRHGYTAQGVELSAWASRFAREEKGLDVFSGLLENAELESGSFDVVVINHVLEHVEKPGSILLEIRRLLKPDGLLVIGVPNIGSIMARLKGEKWASLKPEEHIWHFTPATFRRLVRDTGFKEVWFEAKDNYTVNDWGIKAIIVRGINALARLTNRSEAMLLFCEKAGSVK
jgi:SAM-dependent methyltransferase